MKILTDIDDYLIKEGVSILEAMGRLDVTPAATLVVHNNKHIIGTLMDSDIRRFIINNKSIKGRVEQACKTDPIIVKDPDDAREHLRHSWVRLVPVIDDEDKIISLAIDDTETDFSNAARKLKIPVVMMAGGKGTRLYPYTRVLPKALIPVGEMPIAEHIINNFNKFGCDDFYLILNHKKEMIKAYFSEGKRDYNIRFIDEDRPLGTGGGLGMLKGLIKETFILTNCDILIQADINQVYEFHKKNNNAITMVCSLKDFEIPYGIVEVDSDGDGKIKSMTEKPKVSFFSNTGCYFVEPNVINELKENEYADFPDIVMRCKDKGMNVGIYPIPGDQWMDMGQTDGLNKMREIL